MSWLTSVFFTTAPLSEGSGGGSIGVHGLKALQSMSYVKRTFTPENISPASYGIPDSPFLWDYLSYYNLLSESVDLAVFFGNPFGITSDRLKRSGTKIVSDVPAHNLEVSIKEFENFGHKYPFNHMTDPFLWAVYTHHIVTSDIIICPSKMSADYLRNKLSLKNNMDIIPYGCYFPDEVKDFPAEFTVGHVGVNGSDKGQIYLIIAYKALGKGKIKIAGIGTEAWQGVGLGRVENVSDIYNGCSVYVQPSVTEGFGLPILEAMAHGRPVIATDGCGAAELIEEGKNGMVVPIRDPQSIANKLLYFHDNPDEVKRMGANARETAKNYTWEKVEKRYQDAFMESVK